MSVIQFYVYGLMVDGGFVYVGQTDHPESRMALHRNSTVKGLDASMTIFKCFKTRVEALRFERKMIMDLQAKGQAQLNKSSSKPKAQGTQVRISDEILLPLSQLASRENRSLPRQVDCILKQFLASDAKKPKPKSK